MSRSFYASLIDLEGPCSSQSSATDLNTHGRNQHCHGPLPKSPYCQPTINLSLNLFMTCCRITSTFEGLGCNSPKVWQLDRNCPASEAGRCESQMMSPARRRVGLHHPFNTSKGECQARQGPQRVAAPVQLGCPLSKVTSGCFSSLSCDQEGSQLFAG